MIIQCINCSKKFDVDSNLIPVNGRNIQCGSCGHYWFFNKNDHEATKIINIKEEKPNDIKQELNIEETKSTVIEKPKKSYPHKDTLTEEKKEIVIFSDKKKADFSLGKFLSYILVLIISFVGLILIIDTFKSPLFQIFPKLEIMLFNLYEISKDIKLFIIDLI